MPIKYIGRKHDFVGKSLWEIVGNLKDFGVGRIVIRQRMQRYPEPSYYKILKVEALPNAEDRKVNVLVEKTFRGYTSPNPVNILSASYKTDYQLIPKDQEDAFCKYDGPVQKETILPQYIRFPPLLRELIVRDMIAKGEPVTEEPKMKTRYKKGMQNRSRVARDGETPTVEVAYGLGTPLSPELYEDVKFQ